METPNRFQNETSDDEAVTFGGARPVSEFVSPEVTTIPATTSLREAAVVLRRDDVSFAAVGEGVAIEGVISERDLVGAIALGLDIDATTVETIESDSLKWAIVTSTVEDVAEEMLGTYVRHILVCNEDGTLAGVVSMRDLLTAFVL